MFQFLMALVSMALSQVTSSSKRAKPKPPEPGKLDVPTASEGDTVPWVFGTELIKKSNVVWYGHAYTVPIKEKAGGKK